MMSIIQLVIKMNRWFKFMVKCAKVYHKHPTLVNKVINNDDPSQIFDDYYSEDERKQLKELSRQLNKTEKKLGKLEEKNRELDKKLTSKSTKIGELKKDKKELKQIIQDISDPVIPSWLDEGKQVFHPRTLVVKPDGNTENVELPLTDFFTVTPEMKEEVKDLIELDFEEKLREIWKIVVKYDYRHDHGEDWRISQVTYHGGADDCEGLSALFLALARAAGVPPEKLFMGLGHYGSYGHAFPIVRKDGEFYIYEATLNSVKSSPKKLSGSKYDLDWGVCNWRMYGMVDESTDTDKKVEEPVGSRLEPESKEDFKQKKKEIQKDWNK